MAEISKDEVKMIYQNNKDIALVVASNLDLGKKVEKLVVQMEKVYLDRSRTNGIWWVLAILGSVLGSVVTIIFSTYIQRVI